MARIRTIKPDFFTSEDIVQHDPITRLLYVALWCEADREGRMVWKPKTFKMRYFPADGLDIEASAAALVDSGLVRLYGNGLAYIPTFLRHQHVNPREAKSELPAPPDGDAWGTRGARVSDASARDSDAQVGKEGKESNSASVDALPAAPVSISRKIKTSLPPDFAISEAVRHWADRNGHKNLAAHFEHFVGYVRASGRKYVDWDAALMNAIRDDWAKLGERRGPVSVVREWSK